MTLKPTAESNPELLRLEILRAYKKCYLREYGNVSPFRADRVARYHTAVRDYDVSDIHRGVRQRIVQSIHGIHEGHGPGVVILAGNPGMGKSHLINHFRSPQLQAELGYVLVCNSNHWAVSEFEKCLLGWVIDALVFPALTEPHPLLDKVREIGYLALGQLLRDREQLSRFLAQSPRHSIARLWNRLTGSGLGKVSRMAEVRDDRVFRELDFHRFAGYVCDRFLSERHKIFHRYVLRVLLRYLFPEEREKVLHWLRGARVDDAFFKPLRIREEIDTRAEILETVKILISLFSRDVTAGLTGVEPDRTRGKAFIFAFDQTEGRDELFDREEDWLTFFAQLSELYNDLPNVFILFTMTLGLRDTLHGKMEAQFRDRIRRSPEFVLHEIAEAEVLALYRQRVHHWLGGLTEVRQKLESLGNPYLPFDQPTVLEMARMKTLRHMLDAFDGRFGAYLEDEVTIGPRFDYLVFQNALRETQEQQKREFEYTAPHLRTVETLLKALGEPFVQLSGLTLHQTGWLKTQEGLASLYVEFHDTADPKRWAVVYLVWLPFHYMARIEGCANLLFHKARSRYQLWLLRPNRIDVEEATLREGYTVRARVLPSATQTTFQALLRVHEKQTAGAYDARTWEKELPDLLSEMQRTYLGELVDSVRKMLQGPQETQEPSTGELTQPAEQPLVPAATQE